MDFMATKGIEYLLVLAYLGLLIPFWRMLSGALGDRPVPVAAPAHPLGRSWFAVPDGLHFHRGHTWALPLSGDRVRVGMDDFAHRLVGPIGRLRLPQPGEQLTAGEEGWRVQVDGEELPLLSPVSGRVEAVNEEASREPSSVGGDPYGRGWLLEVQPPSLLSALRNLMPATLARSWTERAAEELSGLMAPELGTVLADGGTPVNGLARALAGEQWRPLAERMLLSEPATERR